MARIGKKMAFVFVFGAAAIGAALFGWGCEGAGVTGGTLTVDFTGDYSLAGSNDAGTCLPQWNDSDTFTGVQMHLTQVRDSATQVDTVHAMVNGAGALGLGLLLGTNQFTGVGRANSVTLNAYGTRQYNSDSCAYVVNATVNLILNGKVVDGEILYRPVTNGNPKCGALLSCSNRQRFQGVKP